MHAHYKDIISRIETPPIWYDEYAVPRYCIFEPSYSASIHIGEIALIEVTCQECQRKFAVALSLVNFRSQAIAEAIGQKLLHYGDPPRHDIGSDGSYQCIAGDSMNSEPRRVLEYWRRHDPKYCEGDRIIDVRAYMAWVRDPSLEIDIQPEWV